MGDATEDLSERLGAATGSLLNATFGHAPERILGLRTHKGQLAQALPGDTLTVHGRAGPTGSPWPRIGLLLLAAAATAVASELLVDSLGGTLARLRLPETFVGVIIVAIVGNAA